MPIIKKFMQKEDNAPEEKRETLIPRENLARVPLKAFSPFFFVKVPLEGKVKKRKEKREKVIS